MRAVVRGREIYAHALAANGENGKFCARDIAAKTDAAAREGCYEKDCALEAKSGADEKQGSADLLAKERHAASETQRDFAALKKSKKSDIAAEAANSADVKFCAHTLMASEKFCARDFAAQDASKNLTRPTFRRKARAKNSA